jgi:hypothetical protein
VSAAPCLEMPPTPPPTMSTESTEPTAWVDSRKTLDLGVCHTITAGPLLTACALSTSGNTWGKDRIGRFGYSRGARGDVFSQHALRTASHQRLICALRCFPC